MSSLSDAAAEAVQWLDGAGLAGIAVFAAVYVAFTVLWVPGSVLTLGAGFAYGPVGGTLLVSPVSVVAAVVAFALSRSTLRPRIARRFARGRRFAAWDGAIARRGGRIVLLLRLSPLVPYTALNYLCGLTRIDFRVYAAASFVGMLPGTLMYTYLGASIPRAADLAGGVGDHTVAQQVLYWGGLVATVAAALAITRVARRALREAVPSPD